MCDLFNNRIGDMAEKKLNQISLVDFVILQFFYTFRSVYEGMKSLLKWDFWRKPQTASAEPSGLINEKRHFIQLYKTEPKEKWQKPVCYINVIEFNSSLQEEEIRRRKKMSWDFHNGNRTKTVPYGKRPRTHSDHDLQRFYCSNLRY